MGLEFHEFIAAGREVHCYLDGFYVARLIEYPEGWLIQIQNRDHGMARTREEGEEVVRMWASRSGYKSA